MIKKYIIPLAAGIIVSYCFTSMVLHAKIVNPVTAFNRKTLVLSKEELFTGIKDFYLISISPIRLLPRSIDPWIEVTNIRERVGMLHSVVYKVRPITEDGSQIETSTKLLYADTEQDYNNLRSFSSVYEKGATVIKIPNYAGPIDKLRLNLTSLDNIILEVEEISLNTDARLSAPLFLFIYLIWCLVVFLELRTQKSGARKVK